MQVNMENILFGLESTKKEEAIRLAGDVLLKDGLIEEPYIESMLAKEATDITYIGNGIAIPHGLSDAKKYVNSSGISVLHFPQGIQYDDNIAYIIIGIAGKDNDHLILLQELAIKLSDPDFVEELVKAPTKEIFTSLFNSEV